MEGVIRKEQERLNMTISVIDELLEKNKQNMNKTAKDVVEAQLIAYAKKEVKKLQDMRPNPYFGRLDFEDEFGKETIYIGKKGLEKDGELIVVDWRTDLGRLYNAYQGVQKTFQVGIENRPVTIHGKRGIVIKNGKVMKVTDIGKSEIVENENGEKVKYMDDYLTVDEQIH